MKSTENGDVFNTRKIGGDGYMAMIRHDIFSRDSDLGKCYAVMFRMFARIMCVLVADTPILLAPMAANVKNTTAVFAWFIVGTVVVVLEYIAVMILIDRKVDRLMRKER